MFEHTWDPPNGSRLLDIYDDHYLDNVRPVPILPEYFDQEGKMSTHGRAYVQFDGVERSQKFREELSHAMAKPVRVMGARLYPDKNYKTYGKTK